MATSYESFSPKFKVALVQLYPKVKEPVYAHESLPLCCSRQNFFESNRPPII
jgi:predicted amidohydrolase